VFGTTPHLPGANDAGLFPQRDQFGADLGDPRMEREHSRVRSEVKLLEAFVCQQKYRDKEDFAHIQ